MKLKLQIPLSFVLIFVARVGLVAQITFSGSVKDSLTNQELSFVNIGVLQTTQGTVSSEQGLFSLSLNDTSQYIKFSAIGYEEKIVAKQNLKIGDTIYLIPKTYAFDSVKVNAKKFVVERRRGKKIRSKNTAYIWPWKKQLGREIGTRILIKKESYIKSANFCLHRVTSDSILLRVNIYEYKNKQLGKNLLSKNLFVYTKTGDELLIVDLSQLGLVVNDDVMLSLETLEKSSYKEEVNLAFRMKEGPNGNVHERKNKLEPFEKLKPMGGFMTIGFYLTVSEIE